MEVVGLDSFLPYMINILGGMISSLWVLISVLAFIAVCFFVFMKVGCVLWTYLWEYGSDDVSISRVSNSGGSSSGGSGGGTKARFKWCK